MKRIVVCLDGTWNQVRNPKTVTNVVRLAQAVKPCAHDGTTQICYYNSGVGTGDPIDRFLGGVFGRGVQNIVKRAYAFLSLNYEPGDEIYIFGFSRGAYTARALGGLIGASGVLRKENFSDFEVAWAHYRTPPDKRHTSKAPPAPRVDHTHAAARVRCLGVWDTVGSYGVPAGFGLGALTRYITSWQRGFHDTHFSDAVDIGLHALAIDERRRPFAPTFWTTPQAAPTGGNVEQVWFCGAHSNVGGGYPDARLADLPLLWMAARVMALGGASTIDFDLEFLRAHVRDATPAATLYRSNRFWPVSRIWPFKRPVLADRAKFEAIARWNNWPADELPINERVHWSVRLRLEHGGNIDSPGKKEKYAPKNIPQPLLALAPLSVEEAALLPADLLAAAGTIAFE